MLNEPRVPAPGCHKELAVIIVGDVMRLDHLNVGAGVTEDGLRHSRIASAKWNTLHTH